MQVNNWLRKWNVTLPKWLLQNRYRVLRMPLSNWDAKFILSDDGRNLQYLPLRHTRPRHFLIVCLVADLQLQLALFARMPVENPIRLCRKINGGKKNGLQQSNAQVVPPNGLEEHWTTADLDINSLFLVLFLVSFFIQIISRMAKTKTRPIGLSKIFLAR